MLAKADAHRPCDIAGVRNSKESEFESFGGLTGGVTPDPISNSEVKTSRADGTAGEALWESRSPPGTLEEPRIHIGSGAFPFSGP